MFKEFKTENIQPVGRFFIPLTYQVRGTVYMGGFTQGGIARDFISTYRIHNGDCNSSSGHLNFLLGTGSILE